MQREAPRTLFTLSSEYQRNVTPDDYEVIAVDIGSTPPLSDTCPIDQFGRNFRIFHAADNPSPATAINEAARDAEGKAIAICIDGARMLSPKVVRHTIDALQMSKNPLVATLAWHLGPDVQNVSMERGYDQVEEDRLLSTIDWKSDGYELFRISSLAGSSGGGFFLPISESNFATVARTTWERLGGLEERFESPGGGLVNLDFYREACEICSDLIVLLGEGTFHQFHGGVATNVPMSKHPWKTFEQEYIRIRGKGFQPPKRRPIYLGGLASQVLPFLGLSATKASSQP
jgi:glycosyltransferase involved in cell wall biosynthesis